MEIFFKIILCKIAGLLHATRGSDIGSKEGGILDIQYRKGCVFMYMACLVGAACGSLIPVIPFMAAFWLFWANIGKNMQTIFTVPKLANEAELKPFDWITDKIFGNARTPSEAGRKMMFFSLVYSSQFYLYFILIGSFKYIAGENYIWTLLFGLTTFLWFVILRLIREFNPEFKNWRTAEDLTGFYFSLIAVAGWLV